MRSHDKSRVAGAEQFLTGAFLFWDGPERGMEMPLPRHRKASEIAVVEGASPCPVPSRPGTETHPFLFALESYQNQYSFMSSMCLPSRQPICVPAPVLASG